MTGDTLRDRLADLPDCPGCYRFLDAGGHVLYVGKATSLRSRVRSYFSATGLRGRGAWVERMIPEIADVEVMVTNTPLEALLLECTLIKQHRPPYNSKLVDDKHYPYLCLTWSELFPRLVITRRIDAGKDEYFGPYSSARPMRRMLEAIRRIFGLRSCKLELGEGYTREPCLEHHLGFCPAPCAGYVSSAEYRATMKRVSRFLRGHTTEVLRDLSDKMHMASANLEFEKAGRFRDQIQAVEASIARQDVILPDLTDHDAIGLYVPEDGDNATVSLLFVRAGRLVDQQPFTLRRVRGHEPSELLGEFLVQFYSRAAFVPKEVLLGAEPPDSDLLAEWLSTRRGSKVHLHVPQRGEKRRIVALANENAEHSARMVADREELEKERGLTRMVALQKVLEPVLPLEDLPRRIECYDISTLQGKHSVGSMVVFTDGSPDRAEYRSFNVRNETGAPDDYAMMREVLVRRFQALRLGDPAFAKVPDLVLVDGGKGQLGCAMQVFRELGVGLPVLSLAKRQEELLIPGQAESLVLPREDDGLRLLMHIRDEAHRFAITHHRRRRSKAATHSILDDIAGIGPKRKAALLAHFPSVRALLDATVDEIAAVEGMTSLTAQAIHHSLKARGMGRSRRHGRAPTPDQEGLRAEARPDRGDGTQGEG
jgi:excinuclease ABC subunit C